MAKLGIKHYRLSLSWTRILPEGKAGTRVNPQGVAFYNRFALRPGSGASTASTAASHQGSKGSCALSTRALVPHTC
jgi:hypothetical protein